MARIIFFFLIGLAPIFLSGTTSGEPAAVCPCTPEVIFESCDGGDLILTAHPDFASVEWGTGETTFTINVGNGVGLSYTLTGTKSDSTEVVDSYTPQDSCLASSNPTWLKNFSLPGQESLNGLAEQGGGVLLLGAETRDPLATYYDPAAWVFKLDRQGQVIFSNTIDFEGTDINSVDNKIRVFPTAQGELLVTGEVSPGTVSWTMLAARLDAQGNALWSKSATSGGVNEGMMMRPTPSGDFYVGGSILNNLGELYVARLDSSGSLIWELALEAETVRQFSTMTVGADGSLYLGGQYDYYPWQQFSLAKVDPAGNLVYEINLHEGRNNILQDLLVLPDGSLVALGWAMTTGTWKYDLVLVKISPAGIPEWSKVFDWNSHDMTGRRLAYTSDGTILVGAGVDQSLGLAGFDLSGQQKWGKYFAPADFALGPPSVLKAAREGGILVGGTDPSDDVFFMRTDHLGLLQGACTNPTDSIWSEVTVTWDVTYPDHQVPGSLVWTDLNVSPPVQAVPGEVLICEAFSTLPPREVSSGLGGQGMEFTDHDTLTWEDGIENGSTTFNLYRGLLDLLDLGYGQCLSAGLGSASGTDSQTPGSGEVWFYLVTGVNSSGEGQAGLSSQGMPRVPNTSCP